MNRVFITILLLVCTITTVIAEPQVTPALPDLKDVVAGPYCGIYSLYAYLDTFDILETC